MKLGRIKALLTESYNSQYDAFIANVNRKIDLIIKDVKSNHAQNSTVFPATYAFFTISFEKELTDFYEWKRSNWLKCLLRDSNCHDQISELLRGKNANVLSWVNKFEVQVQFSIQKN